MNARDLLLTAQRYWRFVAYPVCLCLAMGFGYLLLAPSSYTATARLLINPNAAAQTKDIHPDSMMEKAYLDTQVDVLDSQQFSEIVVRDNALANDPELASPDVRALLLQWLAALLPVNTAPQVDPAARAFDMAVVKFHSLTRVSRVGATYIVEVSVTASTREKAAAFANAVARTFIAGQRTDMQEAFARSSVALDQEIARLQAKLAEADLATDDYRGRQNLLESSTDDQAQRQVADLKQQWIIAQSVAEQARERLEQARTATAGTTTQAPRAAFTEAPNAALISKLLQTLASARAGAQGAASPGSAAALEGALAQEVAKAVSFYQDAYDLAQSHEESLRRDLDKAYRRQSLNAAHREYLRNLEAEASTLRSLYSDRVKRRFELQPQEETQQVAATLAGPAKPPLHRSAPKAIFVLGIAGLLGSVIGSGAAFIWHHLDDALHFPSQVEEVLGLPCLGVLPRLPSSRRRRLLRGRGPAPDALAARQSGQFARALHAVCSALDLHSTSRGTKTVGVISTCPREGRTTLSTSLSKHLSELDHRVLQICVDPPRGFADAIPGKLPPLPITVHRDPESPVNIVHVAEDGGRPNDPRAGARHLRSVIDSSCASHDYIVVDLPPFTTGVTILDAALVIDRFVLVVAAGKASRTRIIEELKANPAIVCRLLGVVLN